MDVRPKQLHGGPAWERSAEQLEASCGGLVTTPVAEKDAASSSEPPLLIPVRSSPSSSSSSSSTPTTRRAPLSIIRCNHSVCSDPEPVPNSRIAALPVGTREAMLAWGSTAPNHISSSTSTTTSGGPRTVLFVKKWRDREAKRAAVSLADWLVAAAAPRAQVYVFADPEEEEGEEEGAPVHRERGFSGAGGSAEGGGSDDAGADADGEGDREGEGGRGDGGGSTAWPSRFPRLHIPNRTACGGGGGGDGGAVQAAVAGPFSLSASSSSSSSSPSSSPVSPDDIDLVVCVGGDGTVLHLSSLFPSAFPPVIAVAFGSFGFLTAHSERSARRLLATLFSVSPSRSAALKRGGPGAGLSRRGAEGAGGGLGGPPPPAPLGGIALPLPAAESSNASTSQTPVSVSFRMRLEVEVRRARGGGRGRGSASSAAPSPLLLAASRPAPDACFAVLNELLLERGPSPFMAALNVFVDGVPLTTVYADGLLVATQTGSTAYSLSAGGPILQPAAASIVFTPICPHTLSFRPLVFADSTELVIEVPPDARSSAWASFDGRNSLELRRGDCVVVRSSPWPLPLLCRRSATEDWVKAVKAKLFWNMRSAAQKPLALMPNGGGGGGYKPGGRDGGGGGEGGAAAAAAGGATSSLNLPAPSRGGSTRQVSSGSLKPQRGARDRKGRSGTASAASSSSSPVKGRSDGESGEGGGEDSWDDADGDGDGEGGEDRAVGEGLSGGSGGRSSSGGSDESEG
jgi:NAD kinase